MVVQVGKFKYEDICEERWFGHAGGFKPMLFRVEPLSFQLVGDTIRHIRYDKIELISRIYLALRDTSWCTIKNQIINQQIKEIQDGLTINLNVSTRDQGMDFLWSAKITARTGGSLSFVVNGKAQNDFSCNRLSLIVQHHGDAAGANIKYRSEQGVVSVSKFPVSISPHNPVAGFTVFSHEALPGHWVKLDFDGALCEIEDHRNFGDNGFKIFSPLLRDPIPISYKAGGSFRQKISMYLEPKFPPVKLKSSKPGIFLAESSCNRLLPYGFGINDVVDHPNQTIHNELLKRINPNHFRILIETSRPNWKSRLVKAANFADDAGVPLWLSVRVPKERLPDDIGQALSQLSNPPERIILSPACPSQSPSPEMLDKLRAQIQIMGLNCLIGAGTDHVFACLNRNIPSLEKTDFLSWAFNPQQHNADVGTAIDNLPVQRIIALHAADLAPGVPLIVSPVTLRPTWNPHRESSQIRRKEDGLPRQIDPAQWGLFGAIWSLLSLKYLSESPLEAATYFELTGPTGLIHRPTKFSQPALAAIPNPAVYPLFHIFKELAFAQGTELLEVISNYPQTVNGLALHLKGCIIVYLANLTASEQPVALNSFRWPIRRAALMSDKDWNQIICRPDYQFSDFQLKGNGAKGRQETTIPSYAILKLILSSHATD